MLFFIFLLIHQIFSQSVCPFPSYFYDQFDGCLVFNDKAKTFSEASKECENVYGGELVSIHNIYQNAYIRSMAVNHNAEAKVIIGLKLSNSGSKNWSWTDGSVTDYFNWGRSQPSYCDHCDSVYLDPTDAKWYDYVGTAQALTSFCLFPPRPSASPDCEEVWSHWIDTSDCSESCGGCGWKTQIRDCLSFETCPCQEEDNRIWYCGVQECTFPRPICCRYHSKYLNMTSKRYECKEDDDPQPTFETTPCFGVWSDWEMVDYCSDDCGMCGWEPRERSCLPAGCLCNGPSRQLFPCNSTLCDAPRAECCHGYSKQFDSETQEFDCQPIDFKNEDL